MNHKQLKKILRQEGIGGLLGTGIRLFDVEFAEVSFADMNLRVQAEAQRLHRDGLQYVDNIADCDNFALWYMAGVTRQWAVDNYGVDNSAIPFGRAHMKGHDTNIGVCDGKVHFWDYGVLRSFNPRKISEVEFK